ncbi:MAG: ATP-binding cassette domain-containing protein [Fibrobacterales bacterium]
MIHLALNHATPHYAEIISIILNGDRTLFPFIPEGVGAYFSNTTLEHCIENEALYDQFTLTGSSKRSVLTYSSGERKKALLNHLLSKSPNYLIAENPFDALDQESVTELTNRLIELSHTIPIIQIFNRTSELLPIITHSIVVSEKGPQLVPIAEHRADFHTTPPYTLHELLPQPLMEPPQVPHELVNCINVSVSHLDKPILSDINWTIKKGEFWQLKGPNGSGKTTLLTMITGDNPKGYRQELYLFGNKRGSGESVWDIKQNIGYFTPPMMDRFNTHHTVLEMALSGLKDTIGLYVKASRVEVILGREWLTLVGLFDRRNDRFKDLSEVERRIVLIIRAMIKHPPLLILDEPSMGLDDYSTSILSALVNKISEESTTTILYVSHRNDPGLNPRAIYCLTPSDTGSTGKVAN